MRIGVAGLGKMGAAIAARLLETGHTLSVWNRSAERAKPLTDAGATLAHSPAELAASCDAIISMLFDAPAVSAVYRGTDGLLSADIAGKLFIDMSTVRPGVEQELAAAIEAKGAAFLECPVGGTVGPARAGKLIGLAGGEAAVFERARPILEHLCRRLEHIGPVGAGASMKLAINLPLIVFWESFGEAMALVRHLDRDPAWLVELFTDTAGGTNVLKARAAAVAAALAGGDGGPPAFDVDAMCKDLRTMAEEAMSRGIDLPLVSRTYEVVDTMSREGFGGRDCTYVPAYRAAAR